MGTANMYSVVIPFVGTLNDDDAACPVSYLDEKGVMTQKLAATPAIQNRKERMKYYLRKLPVRFLNGENLTLVAIFFTHDRRPVDATNVLDLIQNAGNKLIWNDDCHFMDVHSQRCVISGMKPELERTIVYVGTISKAHVEKISFRTGRILKVAKDFREKYPVEEYLDEYFDFNERGRFITKGFWKDDRFLKIPALAANYQQWLLEHYPDVGGYESDKL
jgi:hypothetical protein